MIIIQQALFVLCIRRSNEKKYHALPSLAKISDDLHADACVAVIGGEDAVRSSRKVQVEVGQAQQS